MPSNTGIWTQEEADRGHIFSPKLLENIIGLLDPTVTVMDFGCGKGDYVKGLVDSRFHDVRGLDGIILEPHNAHFQVQDLSVDFDMGFRGNVISLEVGEHIPAQYEHIFISNLAKHCSDILILSWARIGQGGIGHVNCRNNEYIINKISKYGFSLDQQVTDNFRNNIEEHCRYFRRTLMVFRKNK